MMNTLRGWLCAALHRGHYAYRPISGEYRCRKCGQVFRASREAASFDDDRLYFGRWLDD